jgi:hypothetical protein
MYIYTYSIYREKGEGGELHQREGEGGLRGENRSQGCVENINMTECTQEIGDLQSIKSDTPAAKSICRSIFLDFNILH